MSVTDDRLHRRPAHVSDEDRVRLVRLRTEERVRRPPRDDPRRPTPDGHRGQKRQRGRQRGRQRVQVRLKI